MKIVSGVFELKDDVDSAIDDLEDMGYDENDFSVIVKGQTALEEEEESTEDVTSGGITDLLMGIKSVTVSGIGNVLIGGPLAETSEATKEDTGRLTNLLSSIGIPEEKARAYENRIKEGSIFLAVPVRDGFEDEVTEILEDNGAIEINVITPTGKFAERFKDMETGEPGGQHRAL